MTPAFHPADLDRLRALAAELDVPEVAARFGELPGKSPTAARQLVREVGEHLLRVVAERQGNLPPALPGSEPRWARLRPVVDVLGEMKGRELADLQAMEREVSAGVRPFLATLPGLLLAECRRVAAEAGEQIARSGEPREDLEARLLGRMAAALGEKGLETVRQLQRRLHERFLAAVDSLHPLALTWDRLRRALEEREELRGEPSPPSLVQRLRDLREGWRMASEGETLVDAPGEIRSAVAFELGVLREAFGLGALQHRVATSAASLQPPVRRRSELPTSSLEAARAALDEAWPAWRSGAEAAVRRYCRLRFDALAGELDRWLEESRNELERRSGASSEPLLALRAMRFEIEDICREEGVRGEDDGQTGETSESPSAGDLPT